MRRSRIANIAIAAAFMCFLSAPLVLLALGFRNTEAIDNRRLAPLPAFSAGKLLDARFYGGVKDFLVDRFPFRASVIRARGRLMQTYLADFNNSRIVWGREHWMFLREAIRYTCDKPEIVNQAVRGMITFSELMRGLGKQTVFMIAPNKATIYPDKVAGRFQPYLACEDRHRARFHAMLRNNTGKVRYLDAFLPTRAVRKRWPMGVYHWFDVHWDCRGTAVLGDLILGDLFDDPKRKVPLAYEQEVRVSDISIVLGRPFEAEWTGCRSVVRDAGEKRLDDGKDEYFASFASSATGPAGGGGRVLLIHDSFANGLVRILPQVVPQLTMYNINNRDMEKLARAIRDSDRIYVEIVERSAHANFARLGHPHFIGPLKKALGQN